MNIYLPDDLHERVKNTPGLEVSAVCQSALRQAVAVHGKSPFATRALLKAALRMRAQSPDGLREIGVGEGRRWATEEADLADLRWIGKGNMTVVEVDPWAEDVADPFNPYMWDHAGHGRQGTWDIAGKSFYSWVAESNAGRTGLDNETGEWSAGEYAQGFIEGAQEVWREIEPLLDQDSNSLNERIAHVEAMLDEPPF